MPRLPACRRLKIATFLKPSVALSCLLLLGLAYALYSGISAIDYQWRWRRAWRYVLYYRDSQWHAGALLQGLKITIQLSLAAAAAALVIGALAAVMRLSPLPSARALAWGYVQFMRCTPLLVQLYLLYFMFGVIAAFDRFTAGIIALALFEGAFVAEIFRAGYFAVPQAQADAAAALGLPRVARWRLVLLPQALPLVLPPLANLFVSLIKHSSIVTIIAVTDLTDTARNVVSDTFMAFEIWLLAGALYISVCFPLAWLIRRWENRLRQAT